MVEIYVSVDENKCVRAWGMAEYGSITENPDDSYLIKLPNNHEFLNGGIGKFILINNQLVKDDSLALKQAKERKIQELSKSCTENILKGFYCTLNNVKYHFSYDNEAQVNLMERWRLFQNDMIKDMKITAHQNEKDVRISVDKKDYEQIYLASLLHKENCISRYRDYLIPLVEEAVDIEKIELINWDIQIVFPIEKPINVSASNTLDKQIIASDKKVQSVAQTTDMNSMAFMELMNIIFSGQIM